MRWVVVAAVVAGCAARDRAPPDCAHLPPRDCVVGCAELVRFTPARGIGWFDDALAGERSDEASTSYVRRDLMMLVQHATAAIACTTGARPLGLGDMSDRDGDTPGAAAGRPRHPWATHLHGASIDLAYYQLGTPDNRVRAICPHVIGGVDQRHCTGPPTTLDARRTALLVGALFESPRVRVIGVDGTVGPIVEAQIRALCADHAIRADACARVRLAYEPTDTGRGWFFAHHNHLHVAWNEW